MKNLDLVCTYFGILFMVLFEYKIVSYLIMDSKKISKEYYNKMSRAINPYGDGMASKRIVDFILNYFGKQCNIKEFGSK